MKIGRNIYDSISTFGVWTAISAVGLIAMWLLLSIIFWDFSVSATGFRLLVVVSLVSGFCAWVYLDVMGKSHAKSK